MPTRDDLFLDLAVKSKFLTPEQIEDCRRLQGILSQNAFALSMREIVAKKDILTADQLRVLNMAVRYEEQRADDRALGEFMLQKGFLKREQLNELQALQEGPYREGRHYPRVEDLAIHKGYLTPQQLHVLLRAREHLAAPKPGAPTAKMESSPRLPVLTPAVPPPAPPPPPRAVSAADLKALESGLRMESLSVTYRKLKVRDGAGAAGWVHVVELDGDLDAYSSKKVDAYLADLVAAGGTQVVLGCGKLGYLSSAGIGVLTGAVKRCRDLGGDLRLCAVTEKIRKVMGMVGLPGLLRTYDAEKGAVMSFKYA